MNFYPHLKWGFFYLSLLFRVTFFCDAKSDVVMKNKVKFNHNNKTINGSSYNFVLLRYFNIVTFTKFYVNKRIFVGILNNLANNKKNSSIPMPRLTFYSTSIKNS